MKDSTARIIVQSKSFYMELQSIPEEDRYLFAYVMTIRNLGLDTVQLLSRYWLITDANGRQTEVRGQGVIGEQPIIQRHEAHEYTSATVLETPIGTMQGHYVMKNEQGTLFQVEIPIFRLAVPNCLN